MDLYWDPLLVGLLSYLAGIASHIIIDRNRRRLDTGETYKAIIVELSELRYRMAGIAYDLLLSGGSLRRPELELVYRAVRQYEIPPRDERLAKAFGDLLRMDDKQLEVMTYMTQRQRSRSGVGKSLKKAAAPLLDAKLGQLVGLAPDVQNKLLEIKAHIAIFNEEVDQQRLYFNLTFTATGDNHRIATANCAGAENNVGDRARILVQKISELPELSLPTDGIPQPTVDGSGEPQGAAA